MYMKIRNDQIFFMKLFSYEMTYARNDQSRSEMTWVRIDL